MKTSAEKLLSVMLTHGDELAINVVRVVKQEWFDIGFHKKVYNAITDLVKNNRGVDMMTVVMWLREKNMLEGNMVSQISQLTGAHTGVIMIDSIVGTLEYEYKKRKVSSFLTEQSRKLENDNFLVDDFIEKYKDLKEVLHNAQVEKVDNADLIYEVLMNHDKAEKGEIQGLEIGFPSLHRKILLEDVDVMVLAGRPAMGKTACAISIMCNLAFNYNTKSVFFSLEMSKNQMMRRIVSYITGINSNDIKYGKCTPEQKQVIRELQTREEFENIIIHDGSHTMNDILRKSTDHKHNDDVKLILIDYLQKITGTNPRQNRYELVTENSNQVKFMSQNLKIPTIALAQLSRSNTQRGGDMRPRLKDLRDSGEIEQDASIVAFLHRPFYYGIKEDEHGNDTETLGQFIIAKNREGELGMVKFTVDLPCSKWKAYEGKEIEIKTTNDGEQKDMPF